MKKYKSILLVDDDTTSNFISELIIQKLSIAESVTSLKNGREALTYVSTHCVLQCNDDCPQIVFLDLHMPVMDGFDFLKQLTIQIPDYFNLFKIYILTSSNNPADIEKVMEYNVEGYINKPLNAEKIMMLIQ
ncbi:MAG: response regulator [Cytophagales bacterium]|nr:response regulator [Cytophaga sp.]